MRQGKARGGSSLFAAVLAGVVLVGCGSTDENSGATPSSGHATPSPVYVQGADTAPSGTLSQWVSYADAVVVGSVVSSDTVPAPHVAEHHEGYVPQQLTIKVRRSLWNSPAAGSLPEQFTIPGFGWTVHEGVQHPVMIHEAARPSVGGTFVFAVAAVDDGYDLISPRAIVPVRSGEIVGVQDSSSAAVERLAGHSVQEAASLLAEAKPVPLAKKFRDLPLRERVQAVLTASAPSS